MQTAQPRARLGLFASDDRMSLEHWHDDDPSFIVLTETKFRLVARRFFITIRSQTRASGGKLSLRRLRRLQSLHLLLARREGAFATLAPAPLAIMLAVADESAPAVFACSSLGYAGRRRRPDPALLVSARASPRAPERRDEPGRNTFSRWRRGGAASREITDRRSNG